MTRLLSSAILLAAAIAAPAAQSDGFDEEAVVLAFHKVSGEALDVQSLAASSDAARRASGFDRPDVVKAEAARLQARLDGASAAREFVISVNDSISQYDHDAGEFSIQLFTPGHYVPVDAFGRRYQLVFANADRARRIPMAREEARAFDARLARNGRQVTDEVRFRVIGQGDPAGAVRGSLTIRAEIVAVRVLEGSGQVLFIPDLALASPAETIAAAFDPAKADVAGLRVGVPASDLEATLTRLYGPVKRGGASQTSYAKFTGSIGMNSSGCYSVPGRRGNPRPGTVCIEAYFDKDEIVRSVSIERYFSYFDPALLRKALVAKYGPLPGGAAHGALAWGPDAGPNQKALTVTYKADNDLFGDALNRSPNVSVTLRLVDAAWVAANLR